MTFWEIAGILIAVAVGIEIRLFIYGNTHFVPVASAINRNAVASLALYHAFVKALKRHDIDVEDEFVAVLTDLPSAKEKD